MTNLFVSVYPSVSVTILLLGVFPILPCQRKVISEYGSGFLETDAVFRLIAPILLGIPFVLH